MPARPWLENRSAPDHAYRCGDSMPDSTIDIELPESTWTIIRKLAIEEGVSTNELVVRIAMAHAHEVLERYAD